MERLSKCRLARQLLDENTDRTRTVPPETVDLPPNRSDFRLRIVGVVELGGQLDRHVKPPRWLVFQGGRCRIRRKSGNGVGLSEHTGLDRLEPGQCGLTLRDSMGVGQAYGKVQTFRVTCLSACTIAINLGEPASCLEGVSQAPAGTCSTE